jgi:hypothetical protein
MSGFVAPFSPLSLEVPMPRVVTNLFLAIVLLAAGCASAGERNTSISSRDVLTREQLAEVRAVNAYEAVQRLRSQWLRSQGAVMVRTGDLGATAENPEMVGAVVRVFVDNQQMGNVDALRSIEIGAVDFIQYYRPAEAAGRWGRQAGSGPVIYVSTRASASSEPR